MVQTKAARSATIRISERSNYLLLWAARRVLKPLIDLIAVGWILERQEGILCRVLAFEKTREERQVGICAFEGAWFCLASQ